MDIEALYNQYQPGLLRYLTRFTGDPNEAEDVAQEAYLRLVRSPPDREDDRGGRSGRPGELRAARSAR